MTASDVSVYQSPFGRIALTVRGGRLAEALLSPNGVPVAGAAGSAAPFVAALDAYFRGEPVELGLDDFDLSGATAFQRRVYAELLKVPFGELVTYAELAERVGCPRGARAVGGAVGANPAPIFIPCHRVVAAGRGLGGFSGGLPWKEALLRHEGHQVREGKVR